DSLAIGLKNAMRQAPDCILIGEIRDVETMTAAITYAQSGHLVLATLHANNANNALNRIVSFYPPENRRVMLADLAATLRAIVSQRLVRGKEGNRSPVVELLLNTRHIAELIEQGQLTEVKEAMEKSLAPGSQTFEQALLSMVKSRAISREDALANADSPTNLLWLLENAGLSDQTPSAAGKPASAHPALPASPKDADVSFSDFLLNI
ncbi:MAG: Flp pilus assembly complex ATPase component TadA, partial [Burkholderiaceae bacterium]|nr:Flp pilus assembly complex ATPase component TadA [Burkholderiaceae bacterium]